jgi:hypothetical protein
MTTAVTINYTDCDTISGKPKHFRPAHTTEYSTDGPLTADALRQLLWTLDSKERIHSTTIKETA